MIMNVACKKICKLDIPKIKCQHEAKAQILSDILTEGHQLCMMHKVLCYMTSY